MEKSSRKAIAQDNVRVMAQLYLNIVFQGKQPSNHTLYLDSLAQLGNYKRSDIREAERVFPQPVLELLTRMNNTIKGLDGVNLATKHLPELQRLLKEYYNDRLPWWRKLLGQKL